MVPTNECECLSELRRKLIDSNQTGGRIFIRVSGTTTTGRATYEIGPDDVLVLDSLPRLPVSERLIKSVASVKANEPWYGKFNKRTKK